MSFRGYRRCSDKSQDMIQDIIDIKIIDPRYEQTNVVISNRNSSQSLVIFFSTLNTLPNRYNNRILFSWEGPGQYVSF